MGRTRLLAVAAVATGLALAQLANAQQPSEDEMMAAWQEAMALGPEHEALAARTGTWAITTTYAMPGSDETMEEQAVAERSVAMEGRVLVEEVSGTMMDIPYKGESRTGYDNVTDRFWTTWVDTTSTGIIVLRGDYDADTDTYIFEGTAIDPLRGETPMRIEWTIDGPDRETAVFYMTYADVGMTEMMQMVYERQ